MLILFLANGLDKDYKKLTSNKLSKEGYAKQIFAMSGNKILISQGTTTLFYYLFIVFDKKMKIYIFLIKKK